MGKRSGRAGGQRRDGLSSPALVVVHPHHDRHPRRAPRAPVRWVRRAAAIRTYGEAIEVRTADPAEASDVATTAPALVAPPAQFFAPPAQFLWRGRLYLVREVLAHWVELGTWWTARAPRTSSPASDPAVAPYAEEPRAARSVAADVGAVEREVWRVEAASGRTAQLGVYDLVRDVPAAHPASASSPTSGSSGSPPPLPPRWRLARALD